MDRNRYAVSFSAGRESSLSARRAWIEILAWGLTGGLSYVALRKESVDRNGFCDLEPIRNAVALRKESVDRNLVVGLLCTFASVALRKESVDRNLRVFLTICNTTVALRKESVDRNQNELRA